MFSNKPTTPLLLSLILGSISCSAFSESFEECSFSARLIDVSADNDSNVITKIEAKIISVEITSFWNCSFQNSYGEVLLMEGRIEFTDPISSFRSGAVLQLDYKNYPTKWDSGFVFEKVWRVRSVRYDHLSEEATPITVLGEVVNPGEYMVENRGLLNALHAAGGFTDRGHERISISGPGNSNSSSSKYWFRFSVKELLLNQNGDLWIPPGWTVEVPSSYFGGPTSVYNPRVEKYLSLRREQKAPKYNMELMQYHTEGIESTGIEK